MVASPSNQFGDFGSTADPNMPRGVNTTTDTIKKGLLRQPPLDFIVQMLSPSKSPSSSDGYTFDMRITPLSSFLSSSSSSSSASSEAASAASTAHASSTYVIHRTWEDCLWFQESLSQAFANRSRQKKSRLASSKGVKTSSSGVYKTSDHASSWESLPYGPAPSSISTSLHTYLPKLTKKGTFFKPSQKTIDTRYRELKAFVGALFGGDEDSMPVLLKEMRGERVVTDFFGVWRRDWDIGVKRGEITPTPNRSFGRKRAGSLGSASTSSDGSGSSGSSRHSTSTLMTTISEDSDDRSTLKSYRPAPAPPPRPSRPPPSLRHRESVQTIDSAQTYLYDLGVSLPPSSLRGKRDSVATFMTDVSSEAVLQAEPEFVPPSKSSSSSLETDPRIIFSSSSPDLLTNVPVTATRASFDLDTPQTPRPSHLSFSYSPHIVVDSSSLSLSSPSVLSFDDDEEPEPQRTITMKASLSSPVQLTVMLRVYEEDMYDDMRKKLKDKVDSVLASESQPRKLGTDFAITTAQGTNVIASEKDWRVFLEQQGAMGKVVVKILDTLS